MYVFPHRIVAWILLIVAMVLGVVSAATSMWNKQTLGKDQFGIVKGSLSLKVGPFQSCATATGSVMGLKTSAKDCKSTSTVLSENLSKDSKLNAKLKTVQAMTIVSIISSGLAVLLCGLSHVKDHNGDTVRGLHNTSVFFAWLAGVSGAIAIGVFTAIKNMSSHLKWGYVLMCVSTGLSFIGALMITAPAIPVTDIAPSSPTGETIVSAAIAGATGVPVGEVTAKHEEGKAAIVDKNLAKAVHDPHSAEAQAVAADHESEVHAGVAEPNPHPLK